MTKEKTKTADDELDERAMRLARETLTGDIRDIILNDMKDRKSTLPWNLRSEAEQTEIIDHVARLSAGIVERVVKIVAAGGRRTIHASLKKVTVTDAIKAEIELSKADQQRHELIDATGASVLIVVADAEAFTGERDPVAINKEQGELIDPETGEIKEPPKRNGKDGPQLAA